MQAITQGENVVCIFEDKDYLLLALVIFLAAKMIECIFYIAAC
jgi:hypothetical protein